MKKMAIRKEGLYGVEECVSPAIDDKVIVSIVNTETGEYVTIPFIGYITSVSKNLNYGDGELCIELIEKEQDCRCCQ
jgi:hypothetical protein